MARGEARVHRLYPQQFQVSAHAAVAEGQHGAAAAGVALDTLRVAFLHSMAVKYPSSGARGYTSYPRPCRHGALYMRENMLGVTSWKHSTSGGAPDVMIFPTASILARSATSSRNQRL